ncbi:hypothetical protein BH11VER1_BH11VER1_11150 [soil metagenome]
MNGIKRSSRGNFFASTLPLLAVAASHTELLFADEKADANVEFIQPKVVPAYPSWESLLINRAQFEGQLISIKGWCGIWKSGAHWGMSLFKDREAMLNKLASYEIVIEKITQFCAAAKIDELSQRLLDGHVITVVGEFSAHDIESSGDVLGCLKKPYRLDVQIASGNLIELKVFPTK